MRTSKVWLVGTTVVLAAGALTVAQPQAPQVSAASYPIPSYSAAITDEPVIYDNGCHARREVTTPRPCTFTNARAKKTILLFGDSHAAHWFGGVQKAAVNQGWRFRSLTKSGCPATAISVRRYKTSYPYPWCNTWRTRALTAFANGDFGRVDVVVVSNWHFHQALTNATSSGRVLTGAERRERWEKGMRTTLRRLLGSAKQVVLLRDSPDLPGNTLDAQRCFRAYGLAAHTKCGAPVGKALSAATWAAEKRAAASFPGRVVTVDLSAPTCTNGWCGPVAKPYLAFKDDNHWTQTYMKAVLYPSLRPHLIAAMKRATA
jgi:hypothetical protein